MRAFFLSVCLLSLMTTVFSATSELKTDKAIVVKATDPEAVIALKANSTTGFRWFIEDYPADLVDAVQEKYLPPTHQEHALGASGVSQWKISLSKEAFTAPHLIPLTFRYARSWDLSDSKEKTVYLVTG
jgi:predicted secreted protein